MFWRKKNPEDEYSCKEYGRMIPAFVKKEQDWREAEKLLSHVAGCAVCREELSIQFLVEVGLSRLEAGGNFDISREMDIAIEQEEHRIRMHHFIRHTMLAVYICVGVAVVASLGLLILQYI